MSTGILLRSTLSVFFLGCLLIASACTESAEQLDSSNSSLPSEIDDNPAVPDQINELDVMNFEAYWSLFRTAITAMNADAVADLVVYPLADAQYLIGKPGNTIGIERQELIDNFRLVFDESAREKAVSLSGSELETIMLDVDRYNIDGLEQAGRRFRVNYKEDDYESTVMYVFGKTASGYRLIEINLAG